MKKFAVKDTIINLLNPEEFHIYYTGRDGFVHSSPKDVKGYSRKVNAEKKVNKEVNDSWCGRNEKLNEYMYLEHKKWIHYLEIITIEE